MPPLQAGHVLFEGLLEGRSQIAPEPGIHKTELEKGRAGEVLVLKGAISTGTGYKGAVCHKGCQQEDD